MYTKIKEESIKALKNKDELRKNILRVVIADAEQMRANSEDGKDPTDEQMIGLMTGLVKSNFKTIKLGSSNSDNLKKEIEILNEYIPKTTLSEKEIAEKLSGLEEQIKGAKANGQAVGIAMKYLKSNGYPVSGQDVSNAVISMRDE